MLVILQRMLSLDFVSKLLVETTTSNFAKLALQACGKEGKSVRKRYVIAHQQAL